jgi:tellurite resistance protein TerA
VPIDYTKKPREQAPAPAAAPAATPSKVTLTKASPTVSLKKSSGGGGVLRVNLNWTSRPSAGGFLRKREPDVDLDLGCLYEFTGGRKGVVQALGNAFSVTAPGAASPTIWLDGDDRSGSNAAGENLHVDLAQSASITRVLVFAYIYKGSANWAAADGLVTLTPASGPSIEVHLDEPRDGARTCAIALLTPTGGDLAVRREVRYVDGTQAQLDAAYDWGIRWGVGRK